MFRKWLVPATMYFLHTTSILFSLEKEIGITAQYLPVPCTATLLMVPGTGGTCGSYSATVQLVVPVVPIVVTVVGPLVVPVVPLLY